ncbi:hypothetical protein OG948_18060 [Embleya sp. NBC_00888]|nr:hypothetical protein OG948_18060 [Embleya sp. NBC_00888]
MAKTGYVICPKCNGEGQVEVARTDKDGRTYKVKEGCKTCNGSGEVPQGV